MSTDLNNWLMILLILALGYLALTAQWQVLVAVVPRFVEQCRIAYARPILATVLGLVVWAPCLFAAIAVFKLQLPLAIFVLTPPCLLAVGGASGLALRIGDGLADANDVEHPAQRVQRGGRVLALAMFMPLVGWLVLFPWLALSGAGAAVLSLVTRRLSVD